MCRLARVSRVRTPVRDHIPVLDICQSSYLKVINTRFQEKKVIANLQNHYMRKTFTLQSQLHVPKTPSSNSDHEQPTTNSVWGSCMYTNLPPSGAGAAAHLFRNFSKPHSRRENSTRLTRGTSYRSSPKRACPDDEGTTAISAQPIRAQ